MGLRPSYRTFVADEFDTLSPSKMVPYKESGYLLSYLEGGKGMVRSLDEVGTE